MSITQTALAVEDTRAARATANLPRVLILADDLSGAADCAVTGARLGLRSHVVLHHEAATQLSAQSDAPIDVLAIDLDCRRQSPSVAAQIHTDAWRLLGHAAVRLYKKVDSTLRGNVASEVAALTAEIGMAIVAPAFPSAGRTTVGAHQLLHGTPLEETEVWRNEHIPGRADLAQMMSSAGLRTESLTLTNVRADAQALTEQLTVLQASGIQAVVCDAETDDDLYRIARASIGLQNVFWVGSAGLAREWLVEHEQVQKHNEKHRGQAEKQTENQTDKHPGTSPGEASPHRPARGVSAQESQAQSRGHMRAQGPVLAVVGSMSSISHAQVSALRSEAGDAMLALEIDTQALLGDATDEMFGARESQALLVARITAEVAQALDAGRDVLVSLSQKDRTRVADGLLLCEALAGLLAPVVPLAGTVIATGGETARALLGAAHVHSLRIVDEIEHGVPLMHAVRPVAAGVPTQKHLQVVTKAGGFGTPHTLIAAWRRASMSDACEAALSPTFSGPTPAHGAEDRPFHEELTQ